MICAVSLAGCDRIPVDPERTTERIRAERHYRVGLIARAGARYAVPERAFLSGVSRATNARALIEVAAAEPLLLRLEEGALDLVIGPVDAKSPWRTRVSPLPPLSADTASKIETTAFARNGENRWIALLDREARAAAAPR